MDVNFKNITSAGNKIVFILSIIFMTFIPFVAADVINPATPFGRNIPPVLQLVMIYCINLIINSLIIFACVKGFQKYALPKSNRLNGLTVALITLIGYVVDAIMVFILLIIASFTPFLRSGLWSSVVGLILLFVGVGFVMAFVSYVLLFKKHLEEKYAWRSAIIYGILSNPAWIALFLILGFI